MASPSSKSDSKDLECPVCQETFRTPKILPCGHTLCLDPCLIGLCRDSSSGVTCPECVTVHVVPNGKAADFPTNILVMRMLGNETVHPQSIQRTFCPLCEDDSVLVKCYHCTMLLCETCRQQHTIEMKRKVISKLNKLKKQAESSVDDNVREEALNRMRNESNAFSHEVDKVADSLIVAVNERRQELLQEIKLFEEAGSVEVKSRVDKLKHLSREVQEFCDIKATEIEQKDISVTQNVLLRAMTECDVRAKAMEMMKKSLFQNSDVELHTETEQLLACCRIFGGIKKLEDTESQKEEPEEQEESRSPSLLEREIRNVKKCIGVIGSDDGQFNMATCLSVCPLSGNIAVGDNGNGRVQLFDENGTHLCSFLDSVEQNVQNFKKIKDIGFTQSGDIVVVHQESQISFFSGSGEFVRYFKVPTEGVSSFAIDKNGLLHFCCGTAGVMVYNEHGNLITSYCTNIQLEFYKNVCATQVAIQKCGTIYVTERQTTLIGRSPKENYRMYIFNDGKQLVRYFDLGVKVDLKVKLFEDKYFITTCDGSSPITVYDLSWNVMKNFCSQGPCIGQIQGPSSVGVCRNGDLVVISRNNMLQFF